MLYFGADWQAYIFKISHWTKINKNGGNNTYKHFLHNKNNVTLPRTQIGDFTFLLNIRRQEVLEKTRHN